MEKRSTFVFVLIVLFASAIRLLTVSKLLIFTPDEAYQAYVTQTLIKNFHIIWIGLSAGGFNLYLGPFWNYIIYPFLLISKRDPLALGYVASILGILATVLIYLVGRKLFNEKVAIIASLLYASLPLTIYYDQKPYPSGIPLLSLLIAFSLYMSKYSGKWWILFAAAYGMVFHIHLSLIPVIFVAIYWVYLQRKLIDKKIILFSIATFVIMVSPLIAFDYFHKASNITTPIRLINSKERSKIKTDIIRQLSSAFESFGRVFYLAPYKNNGDEILYSCKIMNPSTRTKPPWVLSGFIIIIFVLFAIQKDTWKKENSRLLLLLSLSFLIPFVFLSIINPVEYYLLGFYPLLFLIIASFIESLGKSIKPIFYILLLLIILAGVFTVITSKGDFGINTKKLLVAKVMSAVGTNPYDLSEEGSCQKYGGWRYIFSIYGKRPEQSSEDPNFSWLYPDEVSTKKTKYSVVMKETRSQVAVSQNYKYKFEQGGYTAYIYEH